jgi:hypothetical protein
MNRQREILLNTLLALSTGLFTGGVVTTIVAQDKGFEILTLAYLPALMAYYFYVALSVLQKEEDVKKNKLFAVITLLVCIFGLLLLFI